MSTAELTHSLESILDQNRVLTDEASLLEYGRDWTKYLKPAPRRDRVPKDHRRSGRAGQMGATKIAWP